MGKPRKDSTKKYPEAFSGVPTFPAHFHASVKAAASSTMSICAEDSKCLQGLDPLLGCRAWKGLVA